jgi:hypothetical protein
MRINQVLPHLSLTIGFVTIVTQRMPHMVEKLLVIPDLINSHKKCIGLNIFNGMHKVSLNINPIYWRKSDMDSATKKKTFESTKKSLNMP